MNSFEFGYKLRQCAKLRVALQDAQQLLTDVAGDTTCQVALAGGALRDYLVGKEPKDLDILVQLPKGLAEYDAHVFDLARDLSVRFCAIGAASEIYAAYGNEGGELNHFQQHYSLCMKVRGWLPYDVDLLFLREGETIPEVVSTFDTNLNRMFTLIDGDVKILPDERPHERLIISPGTRPDRVVKSVIFWMEHYNHDPVH